MLEPGRIGGQCRGIAEIVGARVLDHTPLDVTAPGGMVFDSVFCVGHQVHDATGTRGGTLGITPANIR